mgnify:CR=1 FL=1
MRLVPGNTDYLMNQAQALCKAGMYQEAFKASMGLPQQALQTVHLQAAIRFHEGNVTGCRQLLDKCPQEDSEVIINTACCHFLEGQYEEASKKAEGKEGEGGAELAYRWGVEWVRMTTVGRIEWSPGFGTERCKAELFT